MISIDDTQEYQADFVLATLLGGETESQSVPTSASSTSTLHHSASQQRTMTSNRVPNGLHAADDNGTDLTEQSNVEQVDNTEMTNSHSESAHHHRQQLNRTAKSSGGLVTRRPAEELESNFPTGSQFGTSTRKRGETGTNTIQTIASRSHINPPSSHIPPPPSDDADFMDTESSSAALASQHRTTSLTSTTGLTSRERTLQTTSVHCASKDVADDFMDALFEVENLHDVADEGSMFGLGHQQTEDEMIARTRVSKDSDRSTNVAGQKGLRLTEEGMVSDVQEHISSQTDNL